MTTERSLAQRNVSKVDVARVQLDAAILAYVQGNDLEAITLAGAAEEVLGAMCRRKGIDSAVEKIAELEPLTAISDDPKERISYLNAVRNNLKHAGRTTADEFVIADLDSFFMIVRALGNAAALEVEDTENMRRFRSGDLIGNA